MLDIQNLQDSREVPLQKVGVKGVKYPVSVLDKTKKIQNTTAKVNLFVNLPHNFKGTHMSRVNDYANVISKNDEQQINEYLTNVENQTGIQIAVLTIPSLKGEDIAAYGVKVAEKWKLGQKGEDNGALLLVAMEERELRIEVGYGLEGLLTDAKCGLIIRNVIIPEFKDGDYSGGIKKGVMNIGGIACGDTEIVDKKVLNEEDEDSGAGLVFMIIWMIFIFVIITSKGGIFKWIFLSNVSRNVGRNINAGNHSSIHKSGGFGGGNFGGFSGGGGHFGGGGASGHW